MPKADSENTISAPERLKQTLTKIQALEALEGRVHDLENMAYVASDMLEDALKGRAGHQRITGCANGYYLPDDQVAALIFCSYHAHEMAKELKTAFLAAAELAA